MLFYWLQYRFVKRLKRETLQREFERKKEQNEGEHGESAIDGMHVLVIQLGSVDSVLYPVFASDCKQRTAFGIPLCADIYQGKNDDFRHHQQSRHALPKPKNLEVASITLNTNP